MALAGPATRLTARHYIKVIAETLGRSAVKFPFV